MRRIVSLLEYRYTKFYRAQVAFWLSNGLLPSACNQISAHVCRDEFAGRLKPAVMKSLNARLCEVAPPAVPSSLSLEEVS